jgi:hypothetical protein
MFKNKFQSGFLSILYSVGSKPLEIWSEDLKNGYIKRLTDIDINSSVLELMGNNVSTALISCPHKKNETLGIKLPFLVMVIKNMKKYFTFEVQVLDDKGIKRRFRASNYQTTTKVKPFICTMPMKLDEGWNQIQFNLSDFTRRAYGSNYVETLRITIHANCRIRRVYFSDRLYSEEELPLEFKLFVPVSKTTKNVYQPPKIKKKKISNKVDKIVEEKEEDEDEDLNDNGEQIEEEILAGDNIEIDDKENYDPDKEENIKNYDDLEEANEFIQNDEEEISN